MQVLRQPLLFQEHGSRRGLIRLLPLALLLVGEMAVSFIGGLIVRNPWLPNYLVDQVSGRSKKEVATETVKLSATPATAAEYLSLMNYDEKALPPKERAVATILNDAVAHLDLRRPPFKIFSEQILPKIDTVQPGDDITTIRTAVQQCQEIATAAADYYQGISAQLTTKLTTAGVPARTAHEVADTFARWAQDVGNLPWPGQVSKACASLTRLLDVLSENASQWKRQSDGRLLFASQALLDQYNAATADLNAAIKTMNGG